MTDRAAIADRLHSLAIHLLRRVARSDQQAGVTGPRLSVLSVLVLGGGPRTMGELADAEHVRPPSMTRLIQAMEAERLVARAPAPDDARVVRIRATKTGERVLQQARARRLAALQTLLADLTATELASVRQAVEILEPLVASRR
ncbi:MAG TPA: MarR family transcriptional regulator [Gemmatimonadales bacterium]|nr:MarR family transcriptional regulator [Gemmatimonadales bacterium]